jgi:menaquinone-dependent protoporphyrinogen oxidase
MNQILILYATREGQTRTIAEFIAARLRKSGLSSEVVNVKDLSAGFSLNNYSSAIVVASVHIGKHEPEMESFVRRNSHLLEQMRAAFVSVSLSQAGVQDGAATQEQRDRAAADVRRLIDTFLQRTQWRPTHVIAVAGALMYTKYNWFLRFVMTRIARRAGASTDTSRDHEFTDWAALDRALGDFVAANNMGHAGSTEIKQTRARLEP